MYQFDKVCPFISRIWVKLLIKCSFYEWYNTCVNYFTLMAGRIVFIDRKLNEQAVRELN
jgi:hypothetical protein